MVPPPSRGSIIFFSFILEAPKKQENKIKLDKQEKWKKRRKANTIKEKNVRYLEQYSCLRFGYH